MEFENLQDLLDDEFINDWLLSLNGHSTESLNNISLDNIQPLETVIESQAEKTEKCMDISEDFDLNDINDFSWFVPQKNLFEEYPGEEIISQKFFMYGGSNQLYRVLNTSEREHKKFKIKIKTIDLCAKDTQVNNFVEANESCVQFIRQIFKDFIDPIPNNKRIRLYIDHGAFSHPINTPFMNKDELTVGMILSYFEEIVQSLKLNDEFELNFNYKIKLSIFTADVLSGQGKKKKITRDNIHSPVEYIKFKHSILDIKNNDNQCLLRAILIGKAYADGEKKAYQLNTKNNREMRQRILNVRSKLNLPDTGCGILETKELEKYFKTYQIMIIPFDYKFTKTPEYLNNSREFKKFIYIMHRDNHFYLVRSMKAYLNRSYFCDLCKVGYCSRVQHSCKLVCENCKSLNCKIENKLTCSLCKISCNNQRCLQLHQEQICLALRKCNFCNHIKTYKHVCGDDAHWCSNCNKSVDNHHYCFMLKEEEEINEKDKFKGYIFFDFEAYRGESNHVVNLAMAQRVCLSCSKSSNRCAACNHIYKFDSIEKFCEWSLEQNNTIQIAHNLKGYDGIFIFNYILKNLLPSDNTPTAIINGTKIIQIKFRKIKFLDSHCFIPMALAEFSNSFELTELKKGFFPHTFNTPENQSYIGTYPDQKYYEPEFFSLKKKLEFEEWYDKVKNKEFDFQKEIQEYCWSDVQLLTQGCLKFRSINIQDTKGVDPFRVASTIASFCNYIFRRNFLKSNSIAIIPELGYNLNQRTSIKAQLWLKFNAESKGIYIQHAKNEGEHYCGNYALDGLNEKNKIIFEFFGCLFHGNYFEYLKI